MASNDVHERLRNRFKSYQEHHEKCLQDENKKMNLIINKSNIETAFFKAKMLQNNQHKGEKKSTKRKRSKKNDRRIDEKRANYSSQEDDQDEHLMIDDFIFLKPDVNSSYYQIDETNQTYSIDIESWLEEIDDTSIESYISLSFPQF